MTSRILVAVACALSLQACGSADLEEAAKASLGNLFDPDSAQFRNLRDATKGDKPVICGEVNAKNRLGGYTGFKRFLAVDGSAIVDQGVSRTDFQYDYDTRLAQAGFEELYPLVCEKAE